MSDNIDLRDHFASCALSNSAICTGRATEYELKTWFGGRGGITAEEICAKQAYRYADVMMKERFV